MAAKSIHHGPHFDLLHDGRDYVASKVVADGFFDDFLRLTYDTWVLPHYTVVEVGAHIGSHTVYLAKRAAKGHVYAFEPQWPLYLNLCGNLWLNDCWNVTPVHGACYSRECIMNADTDPGVYQDNPYKASVAFSPSASVADFQRVTAYQLDRYPFHTRADRATVDFLKIDVEGADWEVAQGAMTLIECDHPTIAFEDNHSDLGNWHAALIPLGYQFVRLAEGNYIAFTEARALEVEMVGQVAGQEK